MPGHKDEIRIPRGRRSAFHRVARNRIDFFIDEVRPDAGKTTFGGSGGGRRRTGASVSPGTGPDDFE